MARTLAGRTGGFIASADLMLDCDAGYIWTPSLAVAAHRACQRLAEAAMRRGVGHVVIDNMHLKPSQAVPYLRLAQTYGYTVEVREPSTPWKADLEGLLAHGTHDIPREDLQRMLDTYNRIPLDMFKKVLGL